MKTDATDAQLRAQSHAGLGIKLCRKALTALIAGCFACGPAWANPGGAQVVNGQVGISNSGNVLTITNSPGSIINWQSFSINPGELTQFLQQNANSSVLNRIVGQNPSQIFGALQSNGKVYLINPNGILFGSNARVDVGGLVASSLDISNSDFLSGKGNFSGTTQAGAVTNQGSITTPSGGQVYLIAPHVENSGIITSPQGEVLLAAGHSVQLVDGGDPNLQVVISAPADSALNLGQVVARGGKIGIYGALVNQNGIVSADSAVVGENGKIVFKASQTTTLAGNSRTTATGSGSGGSIYLLGNQVGLTDNAQVDASGQTGGGMVLVGGDYHGANPAVLNATATYVGADTLIKADALQNGNGGKVIVWSENATRAYGSISAQGGALGGNGGFIETSGHYLDVTGIHVNAGAPGGNSGNWLLDPYDITIGANSGPPGTTSSGSTTVTYTGTASGSQMLASTISTALSGGVNVVVDTTTAGGGTGSGDITVSTGISATLGSPATLTLNAGNNINVNADIVATGSPLGVTLTAANGISLTGQINANAGAIKLTAGTGGITNNTGAGLLSGNSLEVNAVGSVTIVGSNNFNTLAANITGDGSNLTVLDAAPGLTIGTVGATTGVSAPSGIVIYANGFTVAQNVASSGGDVTLGVNSGTGGTTIQSGATVSGNNVTAYTSGGAITVNGQMSAGSGSILALDTGSDASITGSGLLTAHSFVLQSTGTGAIGTFINSLNTSSIGGGSNNATMVIGDTTGLYLNHTGALTIGNLAVGANAPVSIAATGSVTENVSINTTANLSITSGNVLTIPAGVALAGGNIYLTANQMLLGSTATINAGTGIAWLQPYTSGWNINLGQILDSPNMLQLTAAELGNSTAGILRIGSAVSGSISVNAAIAPNATTLSLLSGGSITQTGSASITVPNLSLTSLGSVTLDTATNSVNNLAAAVGDLTYVNDTFTFKNGRALNVGSSLDGLTGIFIFLDGRGYNSASPNGFIALTTTAGAITQSAGANLGAKALAANGYAGVTLQDSNNPIGVIAGSTSVGDFKYTSRNGISVTAVDGTTGITVGAERNIVLESDSASGISQSAGANIIAASGELALKTTGPVSLTESGNNVANLVADLSVGGTGAGAFAFRNASNLTIDDAASLGLSGILTNNQGVLIDTGSGNRLAVTQAINAGTGQVFLDGDAGITQGGTIDAQSLVVISSGSVSLPLGNSVSNFAAATGGSLTYNNIGSLTLTTVTGGSQMGHASLSGVTSAGALSLTSTSGDIMVDTPINAGTNSALLNAAGAIIQQSSDRITAGFLSLDAGSSTGIGSAGAPLLTNVGTLGGVSSQGPVYINNSGPALNVAAINAVGSININSAGTLEVNCDCDPVSGASVTLTSYGNMTIDAFSTVSAPSGAIALYAGYTVAGGAPAAPSLLTVNGTLSAPTIDLYAGGAITNYNSVSSTYSGINNVIAQNLYSPPPPPPPTLNQCVANPSLAGCSAVLPTLAQCTSTPTASGCSVVLPTLAQCATTPAAPGCSVVLPTLAQCTSTPTAPGCSVVLPSLAQCTSTPTAPGCSVVLPTLAQCTSTPAAQGCSAVLPSLAQCAATPTAQGCSAVLPTLAQCTSTPTAAGCSAVLPSLAQCTSTPTAPGCPAVLPSLAQCTSTPTAPGCSAVLPTVAQCTVTPTAQGCSVVLPTLTQCTSTPTAPGCSAVLPSLAQCTLAPTAAGCSAVLPSMAQCTSTPTAAGCSAVLPSLAQCTSTPAAAGCSAVLPTLAQCTATPTAQGCSVVLPTLAQCTSTPAASGCSAVLPTLAQCTATPTLIGCSAVLPSVVACTASPTPAGCAAVVPPVTQIQGPGPIQQASTVAINTVTTSADSIVTLASSGSSGTSQSGGDNSSGTNSTNSTSGTSGKTSSAGNSGTGNTSTTNNTAPKKLYCN
jgi:filamentous hemagglutinin family protein